MDTMKDTTMQPATDAVIEELRMLAEDLYVNGYPRYSSAMSQGADEIECLRAKITEMEKQEPVGWLLDGDFYEVRQMSLYKDNEPLPGQTALYALPSAKGEGK